MTGRKKTDIINYTVLNRVLLMISFVITQIVSAQQNTKTNVSGGWTAFIKGDLVTFVFENPVQKNDSFSHTFLVSELKGFTLGKPIQFNATREAGTLSFNGVFNDNSGTGNYSFGVNGEFKRTMKTEGIDIDESEVFNFFLLDITGPYIGMLKQNGYVGIDKRELKNLAKFGVGKEKMKDNKEMEPGKPPAMDNEIGHLINFKAVGIDEAFIKSFEDAGYKNIPAGILINFKSVGIIPQYLKSFEAAGYKDISYENYINFKMVGVTPDYIKSFETAGYKDVSYSSIVNLKAAGVAAPSKIAK